MDIHLLLHLIMDKIIGVFEHHTKSLNPEKIKYLIGKLIDGTITHE